MAEHDRNSLVFFAADFRPEFGSKLLSCADMLNQTFKPDNVHFRPAASYTLQWHEQRKAMILTFGRFACQTIGLNVWRDNLTDFTKAFSEVLSILDPGQLKRLGFKVTVFSRQEMSHAELGDLYFGSLLRSVERLSPICDSPKDPLIEFRGVRDGLNLTFSTTAMSTDQLKTNVPKLGNLDQYAKEPFMDSSIRSFLDDIVRLPVLMIDADVFQENTPASDAPTFLTRAMKTADEVTANALSLILAKNPSL